MQYSRVLKFNFYSKPIRFVLKNRLLIILMLSFLFGFSFSVFSFGKYEFINEYTENYINDFISEKGNAVFLKAVFNSFLSSMFSMVLCFICGTSMFGVITVPALVIFKGFICGSVAAYLYSVYSFEGVAFYAVIILPVTVIITIVLLLCSIDSINFSLNLARLTFSENNVNNIYFEFKRFSFKFLIYSLFVFVSAIVEALLSVGFIKSFSGIF